MNPLSGFWRSAGDMRKRNNYLLFILIGFLLLFIGVESYTLFLHRKEESIYRPSFTLPDPKENNTTEYRLNRNILGYLGNLLTGALTSAEEKSSYSGVISWINKNSGIFGTLNYEKALIIKGAYGKSYLLLSKKDLRNTRITDSLGNDIAFENLELGDKIAITEVIDLTDKSSPITRKINIQKE